MLIRTLKTKKPIGALMLCLAGCTIAPDRPAQSSYECMRVVRDGLPAGLPDKRAHCEASALIAQRCSVLEAYLAGIGKELRDALGFGDPEWSDWQADRAGVGCAKQNDVAACCTQRGN